MTPSSHPASTTLRRSCASLAGRSHVGPQTATKLINMTYAFDADDRSQDRDVHACSQQEPNRHAVLD